MKRKIFISYSDYDKHKMRQLEKIINSEKELEPIIIADRKRALKYLPEKVKQGINECNYFVPIMTRHSINTQWINQEIGFAEASKNCKIIPIVELQIINDLKGFINKNADLPFCFEGNFDNKRSESFKFAFASRDLVKYIIGEINNTTPRLRPGDISIVRRKLYPLG
jgi:hypothetical protein